MKQRIAEKRMPAAGWFYVSFSGVSAFLGACFFQARTKPAAIRRTRYLAIYPKGVEDVFCLPVPAADMRRHVPGRYAESVAERG